MMQFGKTVSAALAATALLVVLSACQKQEGPVERAGKKVDETVDKARQQLEKAGDSIQDAAKGNKE
jgi:hypothetical protein